MVWMSYNGVDLLRIPGDAAYTFTTAHKEIDADGAPNAYGPANQGLDNNANAGYPNGGWHSVLAVDPSNPATPFVQPSGPYKGFFVAKTSLEDPARLLTDPARYVDATQIPYLVFPGAFHLLPGTGSLGDLFVAKNLHTGAISCGVIADIGPHNAPLGEMSIKLASNLGGHNPNPRTGAGSPPGKIRYIVFPKSRPKPAWPQSIVDIEKRGLALLDDIGGWLAIDALYQQVALNIENVEASSDLPGDPTTEDL